MKIAVNDSPILGSIQLNRDNERGLTFCKSMNPQKNTKTQPKK